MTENTPQEELRNSVTKLSDPLESGKVIEQGPAGQTAREPGSPSSAAEKSFGQLLLTIPKSSLLLLLFPVVIGLEAQGAQGLAVFVTSAIAILGTVTLIGKATEEIAIYVGPLWGGLLNATFGNVTELIIALFALKRGLHEIVRSSITGSILGNLLLVLGASMFYGGMKYETQKFSRVGASTNVSMLWITVITLMVPSMVTYAYHLDPSLTEAVAKDLVVNVSLVAAIILLILYVLGLLFSLRTHRFLLMPTDEDETPEWPRMFAIGILLFATIIVAFLSEVFVGSIQHMVEAKVVNISELFIGVVVVALVGNAAEGAVAIWVARENKMELSFQGPRISRVRAREG